MKIRLLVMVFVAAFVGLLVAKVPLNVVLGMAVPVGGDLSYSRAEGTIWRGEIKSVRIRGVALGDAAFRFPVFSLLRLQPKVHWRFSGGAVTGHGVLGKSLFGSNIRLEDTIFTADLRRLPTMVPLAGVFAVSVPHFVMDGTRCEAADMTLTTDTLRHNPMGLNWQGPVLDGRMDCEDGAYVIHMAGTDGDTRLDISGTVTPDLNYRLQVTAGVSDPDLRQALSVMGFVAGSDGYRYTYQGVIGALPDHYDGG